MTLDELITNAIKAAKLSSKKVIQEHREKRLPIIVWKEGKIRQVKV